MWPSQPGEGHGQLEFPFSTIARVLAVPLNVSEFSFVLRLFAEAFESWERAAAALFTI